MRCFCVCAVAAVLLLWCACKHRALHCLHACSCACSCIVLWQCLAHSLVVEEENALRSRRSLAWGQGAERGSLTREESSLLMSICSTQFTPALYLMSCATALLAAPAVGGGACPPLQTQDVCAYCLRSLVRLRTWQHECDFRARCTLSLEATPMIVDCSAQADHSPARV